MEIRSSLRLLGTTVFAFGIAVASASAAQINGSLPLAGFNTAQNGIDLSVSTLVSTTATNLTGSGSGDFSVVTGPFSGTTLTFSTIATGGGFSFTDALDGTFTATSGLMITHTATNLDVFLLSTYTPGTHFSAAGCNVCTATGALAHVSINQSGTAVSEAITLTAPSSALPGAPEPATLTLFGSALVGLGLIGRKRFAR